MFELAGSQFEKGVLELRLEKSPPKGTGWYLRLGPIRARLIAFAGLFFAFLLGVNRAPSQFFLENGWAADAIQAAEMQNKVMWTVAIVAICFYALVFLLRVETLDVSLERSQGALYYFHRRPLFFQSAVQGRILFASVDKIVVHGPEREPKTPHGFIEILSKDGSPEPYKSIRFKVLSSDQLRFFPLNMGKIIDKEPEGDWSDPQAEV
jgi:hypothetical protein